MRIHSTAVIDPRAELAGDVEVGPFTVIEGPVRIHAGCRVYQHVYVTGWTEIAEGCELHPGVVVGHKPQDFKYSDEKTYCRVGARTILREYATVHRGSKPESSTTVGDDCYLMAGAHVGHDCQVGNHVIFANNVLLAGHVHVADRVNFGGAAVVHQFVRIGELAMIAGNARVTQDIVPYALTDPEGRIAGLNRIGMRRAGFSASDVSAVRDAYRTLYGSAGSFESAVDRLTEQGCTGPAGTVLRFVHADTRRGLAGRSRRKRFTDSIEE